MASSTLPLVLALTTIQLGLARPAVASWSCTTNCPSAKQIWISFGYIMAGIVGMALLVFLWAFCLELQWRSLFSCCVCRLRKPRRDVESADSAPPHTPQFRYQPWNRVSEVREAVVGYDAGGPTAATSNSRLLPQGNACVTADKEKDSLAPPLYINGRASSELTLTKVEESKHEARCHSPAPSHLTVPKREVDDASTSNLTLPMYQHRYSSHATLVSPPAEPHFGKDKEGRSPTPVGSFTREF